MHKQEERGEEKRSHAPPVDKPIEWELLYKAWNEFAQLRKNQLAEYQLLKRVFSLNENTITIPLNNPFEEPLLQGLSVSLITYLREKLNNSSILVKGRLKEEEVGTKRVAYTNKEKFDLMVKKNPLLKNLQERFALDPDF